MKVYKDRNFAASEPLTPLFINEAVHFIHCNLANCLVHPDSILERCVKTQYLKMYDKENNCRLPSIHIGIGVKGEVSQTLVDQVRKTYE